MLTVNSMPNHGKLLTANASCQLKMITALIALSLAVAQDTSAIAAKDTLPTAEYLMEQIEHAETYAEVAAYGDTLKLIGFDFLNEDDYYTEAYAVALHQEDRDDEAKALLLALLDENTFNPEAAEILGTIYTKAGDNQNAHKYLEYSLSLAPTSPSANRANAALYEQEHKYKKALSLYLFAMDYYGFDHDFNNMLEVSETIVAMAAKVPNIPSSFSNIVRAYCQLRIGNYQKYDDIRNKMSAEDKSDLDELCTKGYAAYMYTLNQQIEREDKM